MSKCGTGGQIRNLRVKEDFKRKDGKDWGYTFDHDDLGDTPRDWAIATTKLKIPYTYQVSELDVKVAESACDLSWEGEMRKMLVVPDSKDGENTPADSFGVAFRKAAMMLKWKGVDPSTPEGRRTIAAKALDEEGKSNCRKRNKGTSCLMPDGSKSPECGFTCTGTVMEQPEVCGFNSVWMNMDEAGEGAISDYCQDVDAYRMAVNAHAGKGVRRGFSAAARFAHATRG